MINDAKLFQLMMARDAAHLKGLSAAGEVSFNFFAIEPDFVEIESFCQETYLQAYREEFFKVWAEEKIEALDMKDFEDIWEQFNNWEIDFAQFINDIVLRALEINAEMAKLELLQLEKTADNIMWKMI